MRICLDARYTTQSGASTVIDAFLNNLPTNLHDWTIDLVTHADRVPIGRSRVNVPFRNRVLEFQWSQTMLPRHLKLRGYDIYHSLKHVGPLRCPIPSVYRVPAVGQFVGQYPQKMLDQIYWEHAAKQVYRRADCLIAVSDYVRRGLVECLRVPEERVRTIHNGVDPRFQRLVFDESAMVRLRSLGVDRPYLLGVANVVPVKNLKTAIQAFHQLADRDLQFAIAGNDNTAHARQLRDIVSRWGLEGRVLFLGRQSHAELLLLYNKAEMLLHPSFHEGLSSSLLEAMACGLPIVAANTTSIPETTADAAVYHIALDAEQLANEIRRVRDDRRLRDEMSRRGRERAVQFSWSRCVAKTLELYQEFAR